MPHRNLRDQDGRNWEVWDVIPSAVAQTLGEERSRRPGGVRRTPEPSVLPARLRSGWLAFQSGEESRRLAPIPANWIDLSDAELLLLMAHAETIPVRRHKDTERTD